MNTIGKKIVMLSAALITLNTLTTSAQADEAANKLVKSFEQLFGVTPGKRRNHTKGFCFSGKLTPQDKSIQNYSNSPLFKQPLNVIGRLSHKGGNNNAADDKIAEYGMGLAIALPTGGQHLMSMNTLDFFPVATPKAFAELMEAKVKGAQAVKNFKSNNTDLQRFKSHMAKKQKVLTPYEGSTYNSINSFYLINNSGEETAIRWSFVPTKKQKIVVPIKQDFFYDNIKHNLINHEISWDMLVTLANKDDLINNPAIAWQGKHKQIVAAKLTITSVSDEKDGQCAKINFDPLTLSKGFKPSNDPLLQARRNAYAVAFGKRISEQSK